MQKVTIQYRVSQQVLDKQKVSQNRKERKKNRESLVTFQLGSADLTSL